MSQAARPEPDIELLAEDDDDDNPNIILGEIDDLSPELWNQILSNSSGAVAHNGPMALSVPITFQSLQEALAEYRWEPNLNLTEPRVTGFERSLQPPTQDVQRSDPILQAIWFPVQRRWITDCEIASSGIPLNDIESTLDKFSREPSKMPEWHLFWLERYGWRCCIASSASRHCWTLVWPVIWAASAPLLVGKCWSKRQKSSSKAPRGRSRSSDRSSRG
jgi:hypothetical protein